MREALKKHTHKTPIRLDQFMALCLSDPEKGYYQQQNPIGTQGDFTTAPEISQLFGEIISAWLIYHYGQKNPQEPVNFVEIGAGTGSLMLDIVTHINKLSPEILDNASFHIIETSPFLTKMQQTRLQNFAIEWHQDIAELPEGFLILWGNEFLDALPIRQLQYIQGRWAESFIIYDEKTDKLQFYQQPIETLLPKALRDVQADEGQWLEFSPAAINFCDDLAKNLQKSGGFALLIDYGDGQILRDHPSLQAVKNHQPIHPLASPGESDLTAHVNFSLLDYVFQQYDLPIDFCSQQFFLQQLGIQQRTEQLIQHYPHKKAQFEAELHRLTDNSQMGELFKFMSVNL